MSPKLEHTCREETGQHRRDATTYIAYKLFVPDLCLYISLYISLGLDRPLGGHRDHAIFYRIPRARSSEPSLMSSFLSLRSRISVFVPKAKQYGFDA